MCTTIDTAGGEQRVARATEALAQMMERAKLTKLDGLLAGAIDRDELRKFVKHNWPMISICAHTIHDGA